MKTKKKTYNRGLKIPKTILNELSEEGKAKGKDKYPDWLDRINSFVHNALWKNSPYIPHILNRIEGSRKDKTYIEFKGASYEIANKLKPKNYISDKTLRDFHNNRDRDDVTKPYIGERKTILIIACFLEMDVDEANRLIDLQFKDGFEYPELLKGGWQVYYFNSAVEKSEAIFKTGMWLEPVNDEHDFDVLFRYSIKGKHLKMKGKGYCVSDTLNLEITHNDKGFINRIYMCSKLPVIDNKAPNSNWILKAAAVTNGSNNPLLSHLVLVKDSRDRNEILHPVVSSLIKERSILEQEIYRHLMKNRDLPVKSLRPDTIETLKKLNNKYYDISNTNGYSNLQEIFENKTSDQIWCSFSRVTPNRNEVAVFEWIIDSDNVEKRVSVTRTRYKAEEISLYKGEIFLEWPHLHARMQRVSKNTSFKSFSARIDSLELPDTLNGISATTYPKQDNLELSNIAVREILCKVNRDTLEKIVKAKEGYISYDDFLTYDGISYKNKFYLSSRELSTLSFPHEDNIKKHYGRLIDSIVEEDYNGRYVALFRSKYDTTNSKKEHLLLVTIDIDKLANVKMEVANPFNSKNEIYYGRIEHYGRNAHVHLETDTRRERKYKICNLLINHSEEDKYRNGGYTMYTGVGIDTNINNQVGAYPFVMIDRYKINQYFNEKKIPILPEENAATPVSIDLIDSELYKEALPKEYQDQDIDPTDYFFKLL